MGLGMQRTHSVTHTALRDKMPHSGTSFQRQADPGKTGFGKKKESRNAEGDAGFSGIF